MATQQRIDLLGVKKADLPKVWADLEALGKIGAPLADVRRALGALDPPDAWQLIEQLDDRIGDGAKVPHLTYVGDATIGEQTNIGAATVFVNYDGVAKHRTTVGDHVRIGSDTMLVAPVTVGRGATIGAGTTLTKNAPAEQLTVSRARQLSLAGWVRPKKAK